MRPAGFFGNSIHRVGRLQKCQSAGKTRKRIGCRKTVAVEFEKEISGADDINRNSGFLNYFANFVVVRFAERINAGSDQNNRAAFCLDINHSAVFRVSFFGIFQNNRIASAADQRKFQSIPEIIFTKSRTVS